MNFIKLGIDLLGACFEIYLIQFFFSLLLEHKENYKAGKYSLFFSALLLLIFSGAISGGIPLGPFFAIIAVFLIIQVFKTKIITRVILSLITFSIFLVSEMLTGLLLVATTELSIEDTRENIFIYLCAVVFSKFLVYFMILIIKEKVTKNKIQKPRFASYTLVMPLCSAFTIYLLFLLSYDIRKSSLVIFVGIAVVLLVFANIATLYILDKLLEYEDSKEKLQYMEKQFQTQESHYKELEQRQYEINGFYHNMKNYLLAVEGYLDTGEYERAKERINQASESLVWNNQKRIQTGNVGLDALLNAKMVKMQKVNTEFEYKIRIPQELSVDYIDLCIVIGNALDNAVEACEKVKIGIRKISLICTQKGNYISIIITNTVEENIPIVKIPDNHGDKNQNYVTTKRDKYFHGYGLQSIRHIAKKNKGNVLIEQVDKRFQIKIILYNEVT